MKKLSSKGFMLTETLIVATMLVKVIGAIFKIPLIKGDLITILASLKANNIYIFGTSLKTSKSIYEIKKVNKFGIVVGNEAQGVRDDVLALCDQNIILPMDNNVESLNVGIASAILMWELKK